MPVVRGGGRAKAAASLASSKEDIEETLIATPIAASLGDNVAPLRNSSSSAPPPRQKTPSIQSSDSAETSGRIADHAAARAKELCLLKDEAVPKLREGTLQEVFGGRIFRPDIVTAQGEVVQGPRLHGVKAGDGPQVYISGPLGGSGQQEARRAARQFVLDGLADSGRRLALGEGSHQLALPDFYDSLEIEDVRDALAHVQTIELTGVASTTGTGGFLPLLEACLASGSATTVSMREAKLSSDALQAVSLLLQQQAKDSIRELRLIDLTISGSGPKTLPRVLLGMDAMTSSREKKLPWLRLVDLSGTPLSLREQLRLCVDTQEFERHYRTALSGGGTMLEYRYIYQNSPVTSLKLCRWAPIDTSSDPAQGPAWSADDYMLLREFIERFPSLISLDLSENRLDLKLLNRAIGKARKRAPRLQLQIDNCQLDNPSTDSSSLPVGEDTSTQLMLAAKGIAKLPTPRVRFDDVVQTLEIERRSSDDGVVSRSSTRTSASTASRMKYLDAKNRTLYKVQKAIGEQLDEIYATSQTACYYEMAKLAFVTLLEGAQVLRTGVRPYDPKTSTSLLMSLGASAPRAAGAVAQAAELLAKKAATPALQALPAASAVMEFVFEAVATHKAGKLNEQMAKVLDGSGSNIRLFADTMARYMTLMASDSLGQVDDASSGFWKAQKKTWGNRLSKMVEWAAGRGVGEAREQMLLRLLATQHAREIVLAMVGGDKALHQEIAQTVRDARARPYETDLHKVLPLLNWHAQHQLTEVDSSRVGELPTIAQEVIWGELEGVITQRALDERIDKKLRQQAQPRLLSGASDLDDWRSCSDLSEGVDMPSPTTPTSMKGSKPATDISPAIETEIARRVQLATRQLQQEVATLQSQHQATEAALQQARSELDKHQGQLAQQEAELVALRNDMQQQAIDDAQEMKALQDTVVGLQAMLLKLQKGRAGPSALPKIDTSLSPAKSPAALSPGLASLKSPRFPWPTSKPSPAASVERLRLEMNKFTLDEAASLLTQVLVALNSDTNQLSDPDTPHPADSVSLTNVSFLSGQPMIRDTLKYKTRSLFQLGQRFTGQWLSVEQFLKQHHGTSKPLTLKEDLDPCLAHLGIPPEHPRLLEIGHRLIGPQTFSPRTAHHPFSTLTTSGQPAGPRSPALSISLAAAFLNDGDKSADSPKPASSSLSTPSTRASSIDGDGTLRSPRQEANWKLPGIRLQPVRRSPLLEPALADDTVIHHDGDDGRFPFHHEAQSGTDCGIHALNTFNHGHHRMTRAAYEQAAKRAQHHIGQWGVAVSPQQAAGSGTGMAELALVLQREHDRPVRYLHTELGSPAGMEGTIQAAFAAFKQASSGQVRTEIEAIEKMVRIRWQSLSQAARSERPALLANAIEQCQALVLQRIPLADKQPYAKADFLGPRLRDAIAGLFDNLHTLREHRENILDALLDQGRDAGQQRGELILQLGSSHRGVGANSLGHFFALRWDDASGMCYAVDSKSTVQQPLRSRDDLESLLGDCDGLEMIIPDDDRDPLLALVPRGDSAAQQQRGLFDAGKDIGIGRLAMLTVQERLEDLLRPEAVNRILEAERAFMGGSSGLLRGRFGKSSTAGKLDESMKDLAALEALMEALVAEPQLLTQNFVYATHAVSAMKGVLDTASDQLRWDSLALSRRIVHLHELLQSMEDTLRPATSAAQSLHSSAPSVRPEATEAVTPEAGGGDTKPNASQTATPDREKGAAVDTAGVE